MDYNGSSIALETLREESEEPFHKRARFYLAAAFVAFVLLTLVLLVILTKYARARRKRRVHVLPWVLDLSHRVHRSPRWRVPNTATIVHCQPLTYLLSFGATRAIIVIIVHHLRGQVNRQCPAPTPRESFLLPHSLPGPLTIDNLTSRHSHLAVQLHIFGRYAGHLHPLPIYRRCHKAETVVGASSLLPFLYRPTQNGTKVMHNRCCLTGLSSSACEQQRRPGLLNMTLRGRLSTCLSKLS